MVSARCEPCWLIPAPLVRYLVFCLPVIGMLGLCLGAFTLEPQMTELLRQHRSDYPLIKQTVYAITEWGNPLFYFIYAGLFVHAWRTGDAPTRRFVVAYIIMQLLVSFLLVRVLKVAIGRPRPYVDDFGGAYGLQPFSMDGAHHALPSGHTTEIVGATGALVLWFRSFGLALLLGIIAALVAGSRVYLGVHHPTDLLFGFFFGSLAAWTIHAIATRFFR